MSYQLKKKLYNLLIYTLHIFVALIITFPFFWIVINSIKPRAEIYSYPVNYLPQNITFEHYEQIIGMDFEIFFLNSAMVGIGTGLLAVLISIFPAYASARFDFFGKKPTMISILFAQFFPQIVFVVPFFIMLNRFGLMNSRLGLIISYLPFTTPIGVWMLRSFFIGLPRELEDAALVDGCSNFKVFYKIYLPLTLPGLSSVMIYAFLFSWQELMFAMSFLSRESVQTLPVFLTFFMGEYQIRWGPLFAVSTIATIPPVVIFTLLQKYFISGLTGGAVKG